MSKANFICTTVQQVQALSPTIQRITLFSEQFKDFPNIAPGAYIKLLFDHEGKALTSTSDQSTDIKRRTYTILKLDRTRREMVVDFVLHGDHGGSGPASAWAASAKEGDEICLAGPGSLKPLTTDYDWILFAGDLTALPAIEAQLAELPEQTKGIAVIAAQHEQDKRPLNAPQQLEVRWIIETQQSLAQALRELQHLPGKPALWAACEFSSMRQLRTLFTQEWSIPRSDFYLSSYWKKGRSEEQHKIDKRADQEAPAG